MSDKMPSAGFLVFQIQATNNINEKEAIARDYTNAVLEAAAQEALDHRKAPATAIMKLREKK